MAGLDARGLLVEQHFPRQAAEPPVRHRRHVEHVAELGVEEANHDLLERLDLPRAGTGGAAHHALPAAAGADDLPAGAGAAAADGADRGALLALLLHLLLDEPRAATGGAGRPALTHTRRTGDSPLAGTPAAHLHALGVRHADRLRPLLERAGAG